MASGAHTQPRCFHHQVKMMAHQTIGMNLPTGLRAGLPQGLQKALPIPVVLKNGLAAVATVHDMVDRATVLDPELARHRSMPGRCGPQFYRLPTGDTADDQPTTNRRHRRKSASGEYGNLIGRPLSERTIFVRFWLPAHLS